MQMPVQLYALIWSNEDRAKIEAWAEENAETVGIQSFSRVLLEPLHVAVKDPNIFGLAIDGVVIPEHEKWPPDSIKQAVEACKKAMMKLYSATNGVEPLEIQAPAQY